MKVEILRDIYYADASIIKKGEKFDIDMLEPKLTSRFMKDVGLCLQISIPHNTERFIPVSLIKPVPPYDLAMTDRLIAIMKDVEANGKVLFADGTLRLLPKSEFDVCGDEELFLFLLDKYELESIFKNNMFLFERIIYAPIIEEAIKETKVSKYYLSRLPGDSLEMSKHLPDGQPPVLWHIRSGDIDHAFSFFDLGLPKVEEPV